MKTLIIKSSVQTRQLIVFKLLVAVISARSLIELAHLLKNVPDCIFFSSKLTRLLSAVASGAATAPCLRETASNANASKAAVALAYLATPVLKRVVAQIRRFFRRLIDDASGVAADIGFVGLTVMNTP